MKNQKENSLVIRKVTSLGVLEGTSILGTVYLKRSGLLDTGSSMCVTGCGWGEKQLSAELGGRLSENKKGEGLTFRLLNTSLRGSAFTVPVTFP